MRNNGSIGIIIFLILALNELAFFNGKIYFFFFIIAIVLMYYLSKNLSNYSLFWHFILASISQIISAFCFLFVVFSIFSEMIYYEILFIILGGLFFAISGYFWVKIFRYLREIFKVELLNISEIFIIIGLWIIPVLIILLGLVKYIFPSLGLFVYILMLILLFASKISSLIAFVLASIGFYLVKKRMEIKI